MVEAQGAYIGLADLFGVFCPETGSVYLVPVEAVPRSAVYLRLTPAHNNQRLGVRFAADYEIHSWSNAGLLDLVDSAAPSRIAS
jgi:PD-(D/E)XK nuclease superfamily protein